MYIYQLYGTAMEYQAEHPDENVIPLFVTTTVLSQKARDAAHHLKVKVRENYEPNPPKLIKCNINSCGEKIFHLPFDPQYERTKICNKGEFYASSVQEAMYYGFRRAGLYRDPDGRLAYGTRIDMTI